MIDGIDNNTLIASVVAVLAALIALWLLVRSSKRARRRAPILSERSGDERPYVRGASPAPAPVQAPVPTRAPVPAPAPTPVPTAGGGVADEAAAATTDVYGEVLGVDTHAASGADNLQALKGVGPKLAARLNELGITSYAQLAAMGETEVAMLDQRLGAFNGRVARDRLVEQAQFLARGDRDGFEARFGKLGG